MSRATRALALEPDLDNHDVLVGVVLPNLRKEHKSLESCKAEYTDNESRQVDFTGLDLEMNHCDEELPVGTTIAYRVNDQSDGSTAAEAVFKLNREPDEPNPDDRLAVVTQTQRNHLMTGYHKDLSLGHSSKKYNEDCDADGRVRASANPHTPAVTYIKRHHEISTTSKGRRPGSHIRGYFPCARSLRRSTEEAVEAFAHHYGYQSPPAGSYRGTKEWDEYLSDLWLNVRQRRGKLLQESNFTPILRARGYTAASGEPGAGVPDKNVDEIPVMCPDDLYLTQVRSNTTSSSATTTQQPRQVANTPSSFSTAMSSMNPNSTGPISVPMSASNASGAVDPAATGTGANSLNSPAGGVGGLAPPTNGSPAPQKGVASTLNVTPPTSGEEKIDPYEAANRFSAAFTAERKKNQEMAERLANFERAENEKKAKADQERAAAATKAAEEEKVAFQDKKKRMLAVINDAMETLTRQSAGAVSAADAASVGQPLKEDVASATQVAELDRIHSRLGPVVELAMKACAGARAHEEVQKQRELAAELANLNRALAQPTPSSLTISGNSSLPSTWGAPLTVVPVNGATMAQPVETTTHKASFNAFDSAGSRTQQHTPSIGASGVASTVVPTQQEQKSAPEPVQLNTPGYAWKLAQEFNGHTPGYLCSEAYVRSGGIEMTQKYHNSGNGKVYVQNVAQPRRPQHACKEPITARDVDKEWFDGFVDGINKGLANPNSMASFKTIARMQVPSPNYNELLARGLMKRFVPSADDEGVTTVG